MRICAYRVLPKQTIAIFWLRQPSLTEEQGMAIMQTGDIVRQQTIRPGSNAQLSIHFLIQPRLTILYL